MVTGRRIGPPNDYQDPADVCASCLQHWATYQVHDITGVFDHDKLCDTCAGTVPAGSYVLTPWVPPPSVQPG